MNLRRLKEMNETAIAAIVMGSIALIIGICFIVGIVIIYKLTKKRINNDRNMQEIIKNASRQGVEEYSREINRHRR